MVATYASALIIVVASLYLGRAFFAILGRRETLWFETAVGLALLLVVCSVAARAPGHATTALIACCLLVAAAFLYLRLGFVDRESFLAGAPVVVITILLGSIPFIASGHLGILGIGIQNDLASHLLWSDYLQDPTGEAPTGVEIGYPLGPHGLAAVLAKLLGSQPLYGFLGLILATLAVTGLTALNLLRDLRPLPRTIGAVLVAVPYLAASSVSVAGFKELLVGAFLLCFVLILREISKGAAEGRTSLIFALAVLAAGMVATFSLPAVVWPAGTLGLWALAELWRAARERRLDAVWAGIRSERGAFLVLGALFVALVITEIPRIRDFFDSGAVDTITNTDSKLRFAVSPLELLGAWPSGEFLLGNSELDPWQLFGAVGLIAFAFAAVWWLRRGDVALPAAVGAVAVVYLGTLAVAGLYVESKALLVPATVVMAFIVGALFAREGSPLRLLVAVPFVAIAAFSSFLALRDAIVAPQDRFDELEALRDTVKGRSVMALTSDRFSDYYLRGSELRSPATNAEERIPNRPDKFFRLPVDFDSPFPSYLDQFAYAVTTDTDYQSVPPPNWQEVERTDSYILWERRGPTPELGVLAEEARPGRIFRCANPKFAGERATLGFTTIWPRPIIAKRLYWKIDGELDPTPAPGTVIDRKVGRVAGRSGTTTIEPGETATQKITLPPGAWDLSIQYVSPINELRVQAPGLDAEMPPGMEAAVPFKVDQGPYWTLGSVEGTGEPIEISVTSVDDRSWLQKAMGVDAPASLGNVVATRLSEVSSAPLAASCGRYVDHYTVGTPEKPALLRDTGGATVQANTEPGQGRLNRGGERRD
ncbi:MAG: hypothetical protein ACRDKH_00215 [Solirubrobacterales bacterium]